MSISRSNFKFMVIVMKCHHTVVIMEPFHAKYCHAEKAQHKSNMEKVPAPNIYLYVLFLMVYSKPSSQAWQASNLYPIPCSRFILTPYTCITANPKPPSQPPILQTTNYHDTSSPQTVTRSVPLRNHLPPTTS